ncbi:hypothetical protein L873DRAFT_1513600 [Choiromyces venosus 120613-1]|uniref:Uncharacterized protein n=1 Tax=Choiromyces venosus 120613-1 TaxID=1336337 RepID=A0A3N4J5V6_9PEZI|nr:hypothetical protein L873DRAFT_1513600 [Choiromyces venosus 120613-1]
MPALKLSDEQKEVCARRFKRVGNSLLKTTEFVNWVDGSAGHVLLCLAEPGVEKTYISPPVETLGALAGDDDNVSVLHLYCTATTLSQR